MLSGKPCRLGRELLPLGDAPLGAFRTARTHSRAHGLTCRAAKTCQLLGGLPNTAVYMTVRGCEKYMVYKFMRKPETDLSGR